jgi:hypothetical protein
MDSGFIPKVVNPSGFRIQTASASQQPPFYFGGATPSYLGGKAQLPNKLNLKK